MKTLRVMRPKCLLNPKQLKFKWMYLWALVAINFQVNAQDFDRVDAIIQLYPERFNNPEELSAFITRDFTLEAEKIRAIYSWIIQNIAYDPQEYKNFNFNFKNYRERNIKEEKTRQKVIQRTLQEGIAVCEGYAMLFEKLCEMQGISNYLVRGDTKTTFEDIGRSFNKNHMWNVVIMDGKSYLFDPTWGAGKYNGGFIKDPTYRYFMTPPEKFIKSHYPDQYEDAFLQEQISREEFSNRPLVIHEDLVYEQVRSPKEGMLQSTAYFGEFPFEIDGVNPKKISYTFGGATTEVTEVSEDETGCQFKVPIELGASWLLLYFDDQPALGYKIK